MTIDEAIEILETEQKCLAFKGATNRLAAIKLGIEALKEVKRLRPHIYYHVQELLLGETKE